MNRNSAKKGLISLKDIREYQMQNPIRRKIGDHSTYDKKLGLEGGLERSHVPLPSDNNANFTYGKPTR